MAAGLLLVPPADLLRATDGFLVADAPRLRLGVHAKLGLQLLDGHAQMHFALPPQHHLMCLGIVIERERGIFLDQLGDGRL